MNLLTRWILPVLFSWVASGCGHTACGDEVLTEMASPDGQYIATVFERNCGATTDFSRNVALRQKAASFDGNGTDNVVFVIKGQRDIDMRWLNINHLVIRRSPNRDQIFKEKESWKEIKISYVTDWPPMEH